MSPSLGGGAGVALLVGGGHGHRVELGGKRIARPLPAASDVGLAVHVAVGEEVATRLAAAAVRRLLGLLEYHPKIFIFTRAEYIDLQNFGS